MTENLKKKQKKAKAKAKKAMATLPPQPSTLDVIRLRKKAAKLRKAENRDRPGPQESEDGQSWYSGA